MAFEPINIEHGIALVSIVVTMQNPLKGNFETIAEKEKEQNRSLIYYTPVFSHSFKFDESKISQTEFGEAGFLISDDPKTPTASLRGLNETNRNILIYSSKNYDRWKPFFEHFSTIFKITMEQIEENHALAIGLEYVDQFKWDDDSSKFSWNELFKPETNMLPKDFFDHTHLQYSAMRNRSVKELESVTEHLEILRLNDDTAGIRHHVSILLNQHPQSKAHTNSKTVLSSIENLHLFNKEVLKQLLTDKMVERVGLNKPPSQ